MLLIAILLLLLILLHACSFDRSSADLRLAVMLVVLAEAVVTKEQYK
jgi:hypothetical protein